MTPEEAQRLIRGLDRTNIVDVWGTLRERGDMTDFFDAVETVARLQTFWIICREDPEYPGEYEYWSGCKVQWRLGESCAAKFWSRKSAVNHAHLYGLKDYRLATRTIGPVEVVE